VAWIRVSLAQPSSLLETIPIQILVSADGVDQLGGV
jgi:hypothetical protein